MESAFFVSTEDRVKILELFRLDLNFHETNGESLAHFVYDQCQKLIPLKILELFKRKGILNDFIKDVTEHLEFKYDIDKYFFENKHLIVERNDTYIEGMINKSISIKKDRYVSGMNNYIKHLNQVLSQEMNLQMIEKPRAGFHNVKGNKLVIHAAVPEILAPYIFYMTLNHNIITDFKKGDVSSLPFLSQKVKSYYEFIDEYKGHQRLLCLYRFEKDYKLGLNKEIVDGLKKFSLRNKDDVAKVLSVAGLLPNINGRLKYIRVLVESTSMMKEDLASLDDKDDNHWYGTGYKFPLGEEELWMKRTLDILLELSFVSFPVMEIYYYHLRSNQNEDSKLLNMYDNICNESLDKGIELQDSDLKYTNQIISNFLGTESLISTQFWLKEMIFSSEIVKSEGRAVREFEINGEIIKIEDQEDYEKEIIYDIVSKKQEVFIREIGLSYLV